MNRSDSVLWQKPLHQQKCQKGKVTQKNFTKKVATENFKWKIDENDRIELHQLWN